MAHLQFQINHTHFINKWKNGQVVANNKYYEILTEQNLELITNFADQIYSIFLIDYLETLQ